MSFFSCLGILYTKEEKQAQSDALIRNAQNIAPEDRERYRAKTNRALQAMGLPTLD